MPTFVVNYLDKKKKRILAQRIIEADNIDAARTEAETKAYMGGVRIQCGLKKDDPLTTHTTQLGAGGLEMIDPLHDLKTRPIPGADEDDDNGQD